MQVTRWPGLLLATLLCTIPTVAQPRPVLVTGRVTDTAGAPLAGAYVTVAGLALGTATDAQGDYFLPAVPAGARQLTVSFVGYRTATRRIELHTGQPAQLDFALTVDLLPLEGVLVTARGRSSPLSALTGSAGLVHALEIAQANPRSIAESAASLPGVALGADMPWSSRVQIRGLDRDHVVFLIGGSRVSTTNELAAQFGTVPPADIERIEILKGPVSVLYGTGATGGVVNAIPHTGRFARVPQWTLATSTAYESVADGLSGYGRIGFNAPRFYLMLSQSYRDYASYTDGSGARIPNSQFADYQSHLNLGLRLSQAHALSCRYQWFEARDVGVPGAGGVFPETATVTYPRTRRWLAEAVWSYQPSVAVWRQSELRLFLQTIDRRAQVIPHTIVYQPATDTQPLRRVRPQSIAPAADHDAAGFRWNNILSLAGHDLTLGAEGWQKKLSSLRRRVTQIDILQPDSTLVRTVESVAEDRSLPNSTYRPLGLYIEDEFSPADRLDLNAGLRLDLIHIDSQTTYLTYLPPTDEILWKASQDTDLSWSAQARATYALTPSLDAYVELAKSFRSPGLEERFLYVDLGHIVRIGDPALDSEDGIFLETGLSVRADRLRWNGQVFYNRIKSLVIEEPATFEGRSALRKTNAGDALFVGFETRLALTPHPRLLLSADVSYVRGADEQEHQPLPAISPLNGRLIARYGNRLWGQAALELAARQERVAPGELPTDGHATLDLSAGYGGWTTGDLRHRLVVGLKNALDATYRDHLATSRGFPLNAPGRSLSVSWSTER